MPDEKPSETQPEPKAAEALKDPTPAAPAKAKAAKAPEPKATDPEPRRPIFGVVLVGDVATQHPMLGLLAPDEPVPVGQTEAEQDAAHAMVNAGSCRAVAAPTGRVGGDPPAEPTK